MSQEQDNSQKTEDPTPKRLQDARKKGNLPVSREVGNVFSILCALVLIAFFASALGGRFMGATLPLVTNFHDISVGGAATDIGNLGAQIALAIAVSIGLVFLCFVAGAVGAAAVQNALVFSPERIKPKLERIDVFKGLKRMFSMGSVVEFAKGMAKVATVGLVVCLTIWAELREIGSAMSHDLSSLPHVMRDLTAQLLLAVLITTTLITVADVLWRQFDWRRQLRMSKQEIKDEHKQAEGDPHIKAKIGEVRRERARKRMMAAVPNATVVIANPTHFAVALKYDRHSTPAPVCLAKGADKLALRIREIAEQNGVPVVENPPLARALYGVLEVDQLIPAEHYEAVAEIITFLYETGARDYVL